MTARHRCPRCGRELPDDAPRGVCPPCLIAVPLTASEAAHVCKTGGDPDVTLDVPEGRAEPCGRSTGATTASAPLGSFGDYEVQAEIGRGGMGVVYRARHVSLNRLVALKLIRAGVLAGDAELRRFENEAEAVAQLDHPGIVPIYEVGEHNGQRYLSMKLVSGGNLADRLAAFRDDPRATAALVVDAAEAVHHAHLRGILHRDLKPANILVDDEGLPHVTDFGLAKRVEADAEMTTSGAILGTPAYMAPEQALGKRGAMTTATDVYGIGSILYALLTGRPPFTGDSVVDTLTKVKEEPPEPPRKLNAKVPRDLEVICLKCLEKEPRRRYSSAQALADDLRAWLENRPIAARPVGTIERAAKFVRRRPALAAAYGLIAAVLVLAGFGGSLAWLWQSAERARAEAVVARDGEVHARALAEKARDGETRARAEAEGQREKFERFDYGRTMQLALQEWREDNVAATAILLDSTRPDFRGWEWHYVHRLCHSDELTLKGHAQAISSAAFSPDGSRIVTASKDNTAKVWDANTGAMILSFTLKEGTGIPRSAAFSPDGTRIVTACGDSTAKLWDAKTGAKVLTLKGHHGMVSSAAFSPDGSGIVTTSNDFTAKLWDAKTGAAIFFENGKNVANPYLRTNSLTARASTFLMAAFSPDGARIVTAGSDNTAKVWNAKTGAEELTLKGHDGWVMSAVFSPDGARIVTAGMDNTAKVWNAKTGAEFLTLKRHLEQLTTAAFSPDGSRIVTASYDKTAKVWDAKTGAEFFTLKGHAGRVTSAAFSSDGSRIVTGSVDGTAKVWDAARSAEVPTLKGHAQAISSAAFSPDGSRIVTASKDNTAKVWDAKTGAEFLTLKGHAPRIEKTRYIVASVFSAAFSPDGSRIVTASHDGTANVWDAKTGAEILTLKGHAEWVFSAKFSPDGSRIVTASADGTAKVWDAKTGAEILTLKGHTGGVESAAFSPDGARVVTGSADGTAKVWDAKTGAEILTLKGHTGGIRPAFSPDGSCIVTASDDKMAKVWNAKTGAEFLTLKGHTGMISSAAFSPDASRIVTASGDGTAKVWDAKTGAEFLTLKGHTGIISSAAFSPDGSRIVTASDDKTAKVWDAGPFSLAKAKSEPSLTPFASSP